MLSKLIMDKLVGMVAWQAITIACACMAGYSFAMNWDTASCIWGAFMVIFGIVTLMLSDE